MLYVYMGRFQPFHNGHLDVLNQIKAVMTQDDRLMILIGSADEDGVRNPLKCEDRADMISKILDEHFKDYKASICRVNNSAYDWQEFGVQVQKKIAESDVIIENVCLVGFEYIKEYADLIGCNYFVAQENLKVHATDIRKALVSGDADFIKANIPACIFKDLWSHREDFIKIAETQEKYRKDTNCKYATVFKTVDNVVVAGGHVLMINRKDNGKLALPGGFQDPTEKAEAGARRELMEETGLNINDVKPERVERFDEPYRDPRCSEFINAETTAFLWKIPMDYKKCPNGVMERSFPVVKGADDALDAMWVPLNTLKLIPNLSFHADHKKIILKMLNLEPAY